MNPRDRALRFLKKAKRTSRRIESRDPEALHDFRTGLRRLRAELWLHRGLLGRRPSRRLRRKLGKFVGKTGKARDAQAGLELLRHEDGRDEIELKRVLGEEARLDGGAAERLRRKFRGPARELELRLKRSSRDPDGAGALRRLSRARRALPGALRRALQVRDPALMHEARKQARKLRYAEESLSPRNGHALQLLQDAMGRERDLSVLEARAKQEGLAGLAKRLRADRERALNSLPGLARRILF